MDKQKQYGYDPLTTICKLALLSFYSEDTKFSFYDNCIYIQPDTYYNRASRTCYKDSKKDLQQLLVPIIHCVNKYVLKNKDDFIKNIMAMSIDGLRCLQKTYRRNKTVVLMLQSYIDLISDSLKGMTKDYSNLHTIYEDINDINECNGLWSFLSIQVASDKLDQCDAEYKKKLENGDGSCRDNKIEITHEFERVRDEFILFLDAKQQKYVEFLKSP